MNPEQVWAEIIDTYREFRAIEHEFKRIKAGAPNQRVMVDSDKLGARLDAVIERMNQITRAPNLQVMTCPQNQSAIQREICARCKASRGLA